MLTILSKNKSYASISIEKGILEAHGIRSWIWDTDGCSWYGDQGAIRCRLVVSSDKMGEAIEILNSDFFVVENSEQPKELHAARSADPPPYWMLAMLSGLLAGLFLVFTDAIPPLDLPDFVLAVSSIIRLPFDFIISVETKSLEMLNNPILKFAKIFFILVNVLLIVVATCAIIGIRALRLAGIILCATFLVIMFPWISKSVAIGGIKTLPLCITTPYIPFAVFASIPVGWGLHLIDFYKSRTGFLKALGIIFIHMVTWITASSLILWYTPSF